jgi:hypothetical protein
LTFFAKNALKRENWIFSSSSSEHARLMLKMADTAAAPIITSPVPGISLDLATHLITAVKTRRKFLSKSTSIEDAQRLQALKGSADDATTAFVTHLRKAVEAAKSKQSSKNDEQEQYMTNAATHSLEFLLSTLQESDNSFHLRRAALIISKEILQRSSDARAYFDSGVVLMDFVSVIQRVDSENESTTDATMAPRRMFQQDAIEMIKYLADKFGTFYPKYSVANRLLGEISVASFATVASTNNDGQSQMANMKRLRIERDVALRKGSKACDFLERLIDKVDGYFGILVPRYGGFMNRMDSHEVGKDVADTSGQGPVKRQSDNDNVDVDCNNTDEVIKEEDDDDSIDWEEGDANESSADDQNCAVDHDSQTENLLFNDHHEAVSHTLDIMQRSGLLQEGGLSLEVGSLVQNSVLETDHNDVQVKLTKLVDDLSSRKLPRLNRWINALSHADLMEERAIEDPASIAGDGPVSLVLLSEEKRALRGPLLKRMMNVKSEIETVIQSAGTIVGLERQSDHSESAAANTSKDTRQNEGKKPWLTSVVVAGKQAAKKKAKGSKFKVVYRKN